MTLARLAAAARPHGLSVLGALHDKGGTVVLLGPDEPRFWPLFQATPEYSDARPDPLDRWSKRLIPPLAETFGGHAVFPSDGPPFAPFISWALASGRIWQAPVNLLVHDTAGLFVSFRGALLLPGLLDLPTPAQNPCEKCAEKPCLSACPAAALTQASYDVSACHTFLNTKNGADCLANGCHVRRACPVGRNRRAPAQSAFHMRAFHKG